jgi:hypothetical protein
MRTAFAIALVACATVSVIGQEPPATASVGLKVPLEARTLKGAPYSAEIVNDYTQVFADGNRIVQHSTGRVYRDTDGRVRREEDRPSGSASISIVDPVAGVSYWLDPETHLAWKTPGAAGITIVKKLEAASAEAASGSLRTQDGARAGAVTVEAAGTIVETRRKDKEPAKQGAETITFETSGGVVAFRRSNGGEQRSEEPLAPRTVDGVRLEGRRITTTIPAGAIGNEWPITTSSEEWTSPELQVLVMTDRKDPRNGDSTYRLTHIVREEPAASLFQVPSDYTIQETRVRRLEMPRPEQ